MRRMKNKLSILKKQHEVEVILHCQTFLICLEFDLLIDYINFVLALWSYFQLNVGLKEGVRILLGISFTTSENLDLR